MGRNPFEVVGTCLDDYRIEAYVADRSLATVYRAVQQSTGAVVELELTRALAKPPEQRFESMRAFAEALRQC